MRRRRIGALGAAAGVVVVGWALLSAWILRYPLPAEARISTFDPTRLKAPPEPNLTVSVSRLEAHRDVADGSSFALFADHLRLADGVATATDLEILEKDTPEPVRVTAARGTAPLEEDPVLGGWTLGEIVLSGSPEARLPRGLSVAAEELLFDASNQVVRSQGPAAVQLAGQAKPIHSDEFVYDLRKPELRLSMGAMQQLSRVEAQESGKEASP